MHFRKVVLVVLLLRHATTCARLKLQPWTFSAWVLGKGWQHRLSLSYLGSPKAMQQHFGRDFKTRFSRMKTFVFSMFDAGNWVYSSVGLLPLPKSLWEAHPKSMHASTSHNKSKIPTSKKPSVPQRNQEASILKKTTNII